MGKMKESYSAVYYSSQDEFFKAVENGENQPTYVGLLEIVRVLKLVSQGRKQRAEAAKIRAGQRGPAFSAEKQLNFGIAGAS